MSNVFFRAEGITKIFPGVKALDNVSFELSKGEILALVGENGAGKSTFIKVMSGIYQPNEGRLEMDGKTVTFPTPNDAFKAGICVVHQELSYIPELSVAENVMMINYPMKKKIIDWRSIKKNAKEALQRIGVDIDVNQPIKRCSTAQKQLIEIAKAIYWNARIIILDEPTSALNNEETEKMLRYIKRIATEQDVAIIFITHRLNEVFEIADRAAVLRDGKHITTLDVKSTTQDELIRNMVGRDLTNMYPKLDVEIGDVLLETDKLSNRKVKDISFKLHKGEVLGIYGLMGAGHMEVGQMLFGDIPYTSGRMFMEGKEIKITNPMDATRHGLAYIPSERKVEGLALLYSVEQNIVPVRYQVEKNKLVNYAKEHAIARRWIKELRIKTPSQETPVITLSGGNQQKVVLAKWLEVKPKLLIMVDPTRGIDVGSKAEIYEIIENMCMQGMSVVIITSEMPELMAMSDRAIIMCNGRISRTLDRSEFNQETIMEAAIHL